MQGVPTKLLTLLTLSLQCFRPSILGALFYPTFCTHLYLQEDVLDVKFAAMLEVCLKLDDGNAAAHIAVRTQVRLGGNFSVR
jgi:hypothetical protein